MRGKSGGFLQDIVNLAQGMLGEQGFQIFWLKLAKYLFYGGVFAYDFNNDKFISPKTQTNAISSVPTGDIDGMEGYFIFRYSRVEIKGISIL